MNYKKTLTDFAFKAAHKYPKLEELVPLVSYALSINPQYHNHSLIEMDSVHQNLFDILAVHSSYKLQPELSTESILLHYHGWITFKSTLQIAEFYFYALPKLKELCTLTIEPITSYDWYLYVNKQKHIMKYLYLKNNLIYKKKHLFSQSLPKIKKTIIA